MRVHSKCPKLHEISDIGDSIRSENPPRNPLGIHEDRVYGVLLPKEKR